ncbi:hypothetical protein MBLNU457_4965t3 [Dothideomycetes sp. NU457]
MSDSMMHDMGSTRMALVALSLSFWILAAACTSIRIFGRIKLDNSRIRVDDWTILSALIVYTVCCVTTVLACYSTRKTLGPSAAITSITYVLTVVLAKLSIGLFYRAMFRSDMAKMAGTCVIMGLILVVGLIYLGFNIAIIAAPAHHLSEPLYSTPFSYAYVAVSITWLLTNAITDLCLSGAAICSLTGTSNFLSRTERKIWILVIACLGLGCAASWSLILLFIHEINSTTNLLQAFSYLNRAGGVYIAASSCVTLRRVLHSTTSSPPAQVPTAQTPIVTEITFSQKEKDDHTFPIDAAADAKSIRRLTTITIHDDSVPLPPTRPMSAVLSEPSWQEPSEDTEKRHSRRSFYSYKSALAAELAEFDDIAELGSGSTKRFSRRSAKSMGTVRDEWGLEEGDYDDGFSGPGGAGAGGGKRVGGRRSTGNANALLPWEERLDFTSKI